MVKVMKNNGVEVEAQKIYKRKLFIKIVKIAFLLLLILISIIYLFLLLFSNFKIFCIFFRIVQVLPFEKRLIKF